MKNTILTVSALVLYILVSGAILFGFTVIPKDFLTAYKLAVIVFILFSVTLSAVVIIIKNAIK